MSGKSNGIKATVVFLIAIGALFTGLFVSQHLYSKKNIDLSQFHGTYLETPRAISNFLLTGSDNKPFDNTSLKGHWTMVFFGFTNCGYVCPTTMAELGKMYRILSDKNTAPMPQVVMVSIDPERDTVDRLHSYVTSFNPNFYGARGEEQSIELMTKEIGIAYEKVDNKKNSDPQNYDIQHSGAIMLFNPDGKLNAFFTTPHRSTLLAKDYLVLVS